MVEQINYLCLQVSSEELEQLKDCLLGRFQISVLPKMALRAPMFLEFNTAMHFYSDNTKCQKLPLMPFLKA